MLNDAELRQLTGKPNLYAGRARGARAGVPAPTGDRRQAGRVRRRADHRGRLLLTARLPARERASTRPAPATPSPGASSATSPHTERRDRRGAAAPARWPTAPRSRRSTSKSSAPSASRDSRARRSTPACAELREIHCRFAGAQRRSAARLSAMFMRSTAAGCHIRATGSTIGGVDAWTFIWLMLLLKIPIVGLFLLVRWAVTQTPEETRARTMAASARNPDARPPHPRHPRHACRAAAARPASATPPPRWRPRRVRTVVARTPPDAALTRRRMRVLSRA